MGWAAQTQLVWYRPPSLWVAAHWENLVNLAWLGPTKHFVSIFIGGPLAQVDLCYEHPTWSRWKELGLLCSCRQPRSGAWGVSAATVGVACGSVSIPNDSAVLRRSQTQTTSMPTLEGLGNGKLQVQWTRWEVFAAPYSFFICSQISFAAA